jgi:predicted GH43/DUF377 family glycosyl hydrolase
MKRKIAVFISVLIFFWMVFSMPPQNYNNSLGNNLPIADAGGPYSAVEGDLVTLNASGSFDPDNDSLQYRWDFDNDGVWDTSWSPNPTISHVWGDDYKGEVKVEVTDGKGDEEWVKEEGVRIEIDGTYSSSGLACNPDVISLKNGTYRMYYTQLYGEDPIGGYFGNIVSAISQDGIDWIKEPGVRVDYGGPYDTYEAFTPDIVALQNGTLRMYYTGSILNHYLILSAVSDDGITWVKEGGIRINYNATYPGPSIPKVLRLPNGDYRMYYHAYNTPKIKTEILSAYSIDGLNWIHEGIRLEGSGILDPLGALGPDVIELPDGSLRMFYTGTDGTHIHILSATSTDGLSWQKENKVLIKYGGIYDSVAATEPDVFIFPNGTVRMYCRGYDGAKSRILSAIQTQTYSTSIDTASITVLNSDPAVENLSAFMEIEVGLRVAGSKWSNVALNLLENETEVGEFEVERWPGNPDSNPSTGSLSVKLDMTRDYRAFVTYDPYPDDADEIEGDQGNNGKDKKNNAGNPVWLVIGFEDGSDIELKHTFNTEQSKIRNSNNPNHIEPWEVDINAFLVGQEITLFAHSRDKGSDDLIFNWSFGSVNIYYNNQLSPDPHPSPMGVFPFYAIDEVGYSYDGAKTITLVISDDDGGNVITSLLLD